MQFVDGDGADRQVQRQRQAQAGFAGEPQAREARPVEAEVEDHFEFFVAQQLLDETIAFSRGEKQNHAGAAALGHGLIEEPYLDLLPGLLEGEAGLGTAQLQAGASVGPHQHPWRGRVTEDAELEFGCGCSALDLDLAGQQPNADRTRRLEPCRGLQGPAIAEGNAARLAAARQVGDVQPIDRVLTARARQRQDIQPELGPGARAGAPLHQGQ